MELIDNVNSLEHELCVICEACDCVFVYLFISCYSSYFLSFLLFLPISIDKTDGVLYFHCPKKHFSCLLQCCQMFQNRECKPYFF